MIKQDIHVFLGLQQDSSVSKQSSQFLINAHNIRITAVKGSTSLSITNEKGTKELQLVTSEGIPFYINGTIIGHCIINHYLVLFIHEDNVSDSILRIDFSKEKPEVINLFQSNINKFLNFNENYPIEAISDYENDNIQKVYWIDGLNQPRVINIANRGESNMPKIYSWQGSFDFCPELTLNENVTVVKNTGTNGQFPAGVIQYAFSYYNKNGQETNIFYVTPLLYISHYDRGGSPEDILSNSFDITIKGVDTHFEYVRIYSIMRTSLNATPICKNVADIALSNSGGNTIHYIDTGHNGSNIDPASLLYTGGESLIAKSMCSKDGTLFLGNITISRPNIVSIKGFTENIKNNPRIETVSKDVNLTSISTGTYTYDFGLNDNAAGFKNREYYRLGFQAQYKNGKWSEPVYISDYQVNHTFLPTINSSKLSKLCINYILDKERSKELIKAGYKKVRPLVVFPEVHDRTILFQGVLNPTLYTDNNRSFNRNIYAQSSWFYRPVDKRTGNFIKSAVRTPVFQHNQYLNYVGESNNYNISNARLIEIQGDYNKENQFRIDWNICTLNSPDIEFDEYMQGVDLTNTKCRVVGSANFTNTFSDMSIITSSPTISNGGSGFVHQSYISNSSAGIISGLFYDDFIVDDYVSNDIIKYRAYSKEIAPVKWLIYPWQKTGSLTNDIIRTNNEGVMSSELKRKVISNLRISETSWSFNNVYKNILNEGYGPKIFNSNEVQIVKLKNYIYKGNIDDLLSPDNADGVYFCDDYTSQISSIGQDLAIWNNRSTSINSNNWWKTFSEKTEASYNQGLYKFSSNNWVRKVSHIADNNVGLSIKKDSVRMKYKSTPHIIINSNISDFSNIPNSSEVMLPIVEIYRDYNPETSFGGTGLDALSANKWIPAGNPVTLSEEDKLLEFEYGDTWFSRYDCLKTYPFTTEDLNSIVEIGSFMLESKVNIDGRYDRNRGQVNNLNMSPINFNLFNNVYSQKDNFFTYFILDSSFYELSQFSNQITWSLEKQASAEIDEWTSMGMTSTYNLDGSRGEIRALYNWNNTIYCFQDIGISQILFNSRVQLQTNDGVPIEITNNYKVDGKRYIYDGIGCTNKYTICPTPSSLYFIDSISGHLQSITSQGVVNVSVKNNMINWLNRQNKSMWKPNSYSLRVFYDKNKQDLYIITDKEALCFSELLGQFTSFMSYNNIPVMFNIVDGFYCINNGCAYKMFEGDYNKFFGEYHGYDITYVSNGVSSRENLSTVDKIYNNIEFRADAWSDKLDGVLSQEAPFDYIRVWNEYQDTGEVLLKNTPNRPSILKKKFRVWRLNIPRDASNRRDRIRNTWCKIKLGSSSKYNNGNIKPIVLHDIITYYSV